MKWVNKFQGFQIYKFIFEILLINKKKVNKNFNDLYKKFNNNKKIIVKIQRVW